MLIPWLILLVSISSQWIAQALADASNVKAIGPSNHTNNWAVLVSASRYWFNYRVSVCQFVVHITANKV